MTSRSNAQPRARVAEATTADPSATVTVASRRGWSGRRPPRARARRARGYREERTDRRNRITTWMAHAFAFGWKRVRCRDVPPRLGELERRARAESSESDESRARRRDDGLRARRVARSLDLARASRRADASVFVAAIAVIAADDDARVSSRSRRRGRRATRARVSTARLGLLLRVRADVRGARRSSPLAVVGNFKSTVERIHAHDARSRVRRLTTSATPSLALTFFRAQIVDRSLHARATPPMMMTTTMAPLRSPSPARRAYVAARAAASEPEQAIEVPSMGDSITEGSIASVMKAVGDEVAMDEVVAQIETDKVTVDVRAPSAGRVTAVRAKEGDTVTVGQTVMTVSPSAGKKAKEKREPKEEKEASGPPTTVEVPSMGDSISEGAVAAVLVKPGQKVAMDEVIAQIETDKVTIDVRASTSGTVTEVLVTEGETVAVGRGVAVVAPGPGPEKRATAGAAAPSAEAAAATTTETKKAPTPADPARETPSETPSAGTSAARARTETRVPMSRLRLRVAERLKSSQNTYAMLTTFNEIDMSNVMQMRAEYKDAFLERHGVKLGFMSTFVTAAAKALQEEPSVNAIIDGDEIVYRNYVDISVAVSAPKGLVVPVLRNCEKMSFADVEGSIAAFGKKARAGSLSIDEMAGGTFTISNGGVFGSLTGTPIINPPQSAILGMHSIVWRPVCVGPDRAIVARPMMNVALTYDHRLVDGREAVTFLKSIKESVEDPRRMILSV